RAGPRPLDDRPPRVRPAQGFDPHREDPTPAVDGLDQGARPKAQDTGQMVGLVGVEVDPIGLDRVGADDEPPHRARAVSEPGAASPTPRAPRPRPAGSPRGRTTP